MLRIVPLTLGLTLPVSPTLTLSSRPKQAGIPAAAVAPCHIVQAGRPTPTAQPATALPFKQTIANVKKSRIACNTNYVPILNGYIAWASFISLKIHGKKNKIQLHGPSVQMK